MMDRTESERRGDELLPFYVNGTLPPDERADVEALLAGDEGLRQQLVLLEHIRDAIKADEPAYSPGELGLARLMGAIGPTRTNRRYGWLAATLAAAGIAIGTLVFQATQDDAPLYEQAGAPAGDRVLLVAFRPSAPQGEISDFLIANDITIVDGPSAIGLYRVSVADTDSPEVALAALRAAATLVESADMAE